MPWSNQNGGGWKGGGPWGSGGGGGGGGGPWGNGPQRGGGNNNTPPDLEELLRRSQEKLRQVMPGGGGGGGLGVKAVVLAGAALVGVWLATGFYRVDPGEVGVELVLGKFSKITQPGLNYNWPYPVGSVYMPDVLRIREITIGSSDTGSARAAASRNVPEESQMLTGDENIVDVDFRVQWRISNAQDYLFNIQNPEGTVRAVAESAMREVIGRNNIQDILTGERQQIETDVRELMQTTLDSYKAGIEVSQVQLQKVDPPAQVIDAFRDVQAARADQERARNEAQAYANKVVPEARGEAARVVEQANAYRQRVVAEARGQADRFLKVLEEYQKAPAVTRERMYLETMERVLGQTDKVVIDQAVSGNGVLPLLAIDPSQSGLPPLSSGAAARPSSAPAISAAPRSTTPGAQ